MLLPKPTKTKRKSRRYVRYKETPEKIAYSIFSYVRVCEENWQCELCEKLHTVLSPKEERAIGISHFIGRNHKSALFLKANTDVFCNIPCHAELEREKNEGQKYYEWKREKRAQGGVTIESLLLMKNKLARYREADYKYLAKQYLQELEAMFEYAFAADYFRNKYGAFFNE